MVAASDAAWDVAPAPPADALRALDCPTPLLARLLWNRGIRDAAAAQAFLAADRAPLGDPATMRGVPAALARVRAALAAGETIGLHGDYDVDGVAATAVIVETLERLGARPLVHLPHRVRDGYGLSVDAVRTLAARGARLIVTVDCGVTANAEVALAAELGVDVLVTDHHHVPVQLPNACAVLNPHQLGCSYPWPDLAGVGVAYVLARALLAAHLPPVEALRASDALLDLVTLGTIADMVPLLGENRSLVARGLPLLAAGRRPGVAALLAASRVSREGLTAQRVSFTLAPRLNAAGRMGEAADAYALLRARDAATAERIAADLDTANVARRGAVEDGARRALASADRDAPATIVVGDFPRGIAGLIASRLVEASGRPALVLEHGPDYCTGSARSPLGFHLAEALRACADLLLKYGGHAQAAGLTLATAKLPAFEARFQGLAREALGAAAQPRRQAIDAEASLRAFDWGGLQALCALEPCGVGNPPPVFLTRRAEVRDVRPLGASGVSLRLRDGRTTLRAAAFRLEERVPVVGSTIDVVYEVQCRRQGGQLWPELTVLDWRPAAGGGA